MDFRSEQLIVILTTVLSLLTAWAWDSLLRSIVLRYYGNNLSIKFVYALIITMITYYIINRYLHFSTREKLQKVKKCNITNYAKNI